MRLVLGRSTPAIRAIVLSLPLLVFLVRANHAHDAAAPDDLALVANPLDRSSYFHNDPARLRPSRYSRSTIRPRPTSHWRELQPHPIADQDPHEVAIHPVRDVRQSPSRPRRAAPCKGHSARSPSRPRPPRSSPPAAMARRATAGAKAAISSRRPGLLSPSESTARPP